MSEYLIKEAKNELCRRELLEFTLATKQNYIVNWHHKLLAEVTTDFITSDKYGQRLMVFMPPQTGKTELTTRRACAWTLGINNNNKLALASYNATKAEEFSAEIQRIMDTPEYIDIFPNTRLPDSYLRDTPQKKKRTNKLFEVFGAGGDDAEGFLKAVGVEGSLTGTPVDYLFIDDPVKDFIDAESEKIRETAWNWYLSVAETRLHNDSKVMLTMTRWHHDDLAGRILKAEGEDWHVISLPALKEHNNEPLDPREIGEALWPDRHSRERMVKAQSRSPRIFTSLYQQRPSAEEGSVFESAWLIPVKKDEIPKNIVWDMWVDGAYTKKTENDPTGILIAGYKMGKIYLKWFTTQFMEMPELLRYIPRVAREQGMTIKSRVYVEPKASGLTLIQLLKDQTNLNAMPIKGRCVNMDKIERAKSSSPTVESGRVYILDGSWNTPFLDELVMFPQGKHDEAPDLLAYCIHVYYIKKRGRGIKIRN